MVGHGTERHRPLKDVDEHDRGERPAERLVRGEDHRLRRVDQSGEQSVPIHGRAAHLPAPSPNNPATARHAARTMTTSNTGVAMSA